MEKNPSFPGLSSLAAGATGGVCLVTLIYPFDSVKVRLQTAEKARYFGTIDVFKKIIVREGFVKVRAQRSIKTASSFSNGSRVFAPASPYH